MERIDIPRPGTAVMVPAPSPDTGARRRVRRPLTVVPAALAALLAVAGCGAGSTAAPGAPVITVVTGLWPLAQAATAIGGANVHVVDVVPDGNDPSTYRIGASAAARIRTAAVVLEVGGGFQPSFEAAAADAHPVEVRTPGASPYVWLNPYGMEAVARTIGAALERADPEAKGAFANGLDDLEASLGALDDDYQSTLSVCPDQTLVTVTDAFAGLRSRYPVTDRAITTGPLQPLPSNATVQAEVAAIKATGTSEIYNESWIPQSDIIEASAIAGVKVGTIDTLAGPPSAGYPQGSSRTLAYVGQMEQVLATLSSALHCPNPDT